MTSKERVLTTFEFGKPDRVPINYSANSGIDKRLKKHFCLKNDDKEGLLKKLGVDFRGIWTPYTGAKLYQDIPEGGVKVNEWGIHTKWIEHQSGGYWDFCDFPLKNATEEEVANWKIPSPDDYDYEMIIDRCKNLSEYALYIGNPGLACIINTAGFLRGMENVFIDLITDDPAGLLLIDRFLDIQFEMTRRTLEIIGDKIDFMWIGEDLGTQNSPLISMDIFQKHIKPRHQKFLDLAKEYNLYTMIHTCGSSSWAYEEYIKMGINGVDTLQPESKNMSPQYLTDTFSKRLFFHGCISTAGPVAYGNVDDVIKNCKNTLDIMIPNGGYCFAPTHALQDNSPTENVLAMYEVANKYII